MVLMKTVYKNDRQLEHEHRLAGLHRLPCSFDTPDKHSEERLISSRHFTNELIEQMRMQQDQIHYLLETVKSLQKNQPNIVIVQEIPKEEGKKIVEEYFEAHECADIEELMLNLKIPIRSLVEIIDELQKEGKLSPKGEDDT